MRNAWSASRTGSSSPTRQRRPRNPKRVIVKVMRTIISSLAIALAACSPAEAEPRKLTLAEAGQIALHVAPLISAAQLTDRRARLGGLRPQFDHGQLSI